VRRLVWESAPGYVLHRFPKKVEKVDNSCATEPDNSKNPLQPEEAGVNFRKLGLLLGMQAQLLQFQTLEYAVKRNCE
jgi:hypothetical protein